MGASITSPSTPRPGASPCRTTGTTTGNSGELAALGQLGDPNVQIVGPFTVAADRIAPGAFAWDGEAFALNPHGGTDETGMRPLSLMRLSPDGGVILPWTKYGWTTDTTGNEFGFKVEAEPTTGSTYVFAASYDAHLSGHLRDGTPLPGTEAGPKVIEAQGVPFSGSSLPYVWPWPGSPSWRASSCGPGTRGSRGRRRSR